MTLSQGKQDCLSSKDANSEAYLDFKKAGEQRETHTVVGC